jgi:hypothetical protein
LRESFEARAQRSAAIQARSSLSRAQQRVGGAAVGLRQDPVRGGRVVLPRPQLRDDLGVEDEPAELLGGLGEAALPAHLPRTQQVGEQRRQVGRAGAVRRGADQVAVIGEDAQQRRGAGALHDGVGVGAPRSVHDVGHVHPERLGQRDDGADRPRRQHSALHLRQPALGDAGTTGEHLLRDAETLPVQPDPGAARDAGHPVSHHLEGARRA